MIWWNNWSSVDIMVIRFFSVSLTESLEQEIMIKMEANAGSAGIGGMDLAWIRWS